MKALGIAVAWVCAAWWPVTGPYRIGGAVSDFKLKNYNGKMVSMGSFKLAKGFVIVFIRNTCEYCQAYEDRIEQLSKKYAPLHYQVIAISPIADDTVHFPNDGLKQMKALAVKKRFSFPYLSDNHLKVSTAFGDQYTPTAFVIEKKKGKMILRFKGDIDNDWQNHNPHKIKYVEKVVDSLLKVK